MSNAIATEELGKKYILSHQRRGGYVALRDVIADMARTWGRRLRHPLQSGNASLLEEFWALKDVSFQIRQGDRVGIIGRNGAGKSTLLKVLSRITEPTKGRVFIRGRVASLLEVGTGFHPELTGRENIYLNGAILGMPKAEIKRKFDEIVSFAEVEKFLDTPVKRYSSGMYVRLAFAVAAHLEPDILIVDEVLAVGDAQFQKKCLGKMEDVSTREGRTLLFVSHNMQAVQQLCSRTILLSEGRVVSDAATDASLLAYSELLRGIKIDAETGINNQSVRRGFGAIRFLSVEMQDAKGNIRHSFEMGETVRFVVAFKVFRDMDGVTIYIALGSGRTREHVTSVRHVVSDGRVAAGTTGKITVELTDIYIRPGEYPIYWHLSDNHFSPTSVDVLDDLTAPLMVTAGDTIRHDNYDPSRHGGYFSMPSRLVSKEIHSSHQDHEGVTIMTRKSKESRDA
jgi:lipopolysaccharide transport system ATP-binding protein